MNNISDRELSQQIKENERLVYFCFYKLPKHILYNPILRKYREEIIQQGFVGLWNAIKYYDAEKYDTEFITFAVRCIEHEISKAIDCYRHYYNRNKSVAFTVEAEYWLSNVSNTEFNLMDTIENLDRQKLVEDIKKISKSKWCDIMDDIMEGYTQAEIARKYNVSRQAVAETLHYIRDRAIRKMGKDKLKAYLEE